MIGRMILHELILVKTLPIFGERLELAQWHEDIYGTGVPAAGAAGAA